MDLKKVGSAVKMARKFGMDDLAILTALLTNEGPPLHRREIVEAWAKAVGLDLTKALQRARAANLIPSTHPASAWKKEKLPHTTPENDPE